MKRTASLLLGIMTLFSGFSFAKHQDVHSPPTEFLQSLVLGPKDVTIRIPAAYQMVALDQRESQHKMGFILDKDTVDAWSQYVNLNIITNTRETAGMRIHAMHKYLLQHHPEAKIIDTDIDRKRNGLQEAVLKARYTDKHGGDLVLCVKYYSDSATLIGVEVSHRIKRSESTALKSAERIADRVIKLSDT